MMMSKKTVQGEVLFQKIRLSHCLVASPMEHLLDNNPPPTSAYIFVTHHH